MEPIPLARRLDVAILSPGAGRDEIRARQTAESLIQAGADRLGTSTPRALLV